MDKEQMQKLIKIQEEREKAEYEKTRRKVMTGIVIAVIIFLIYGWYNSEQNRLKLLDELNTIKDRQEDTWRGK